MINENNDPKNLNNLSSDAVDGKNVMGGGFGDGLAEEMGGGMQQDPFQVVDLITDETIIGGGPIGGDPSGPVGPLGPEGPLGPHNGRGNNPLPHGPL